MAKKRDAIRFAVGDSNDTRSTVWRLWATKNDLYLAGRAFAQMSKFSFHQTGRYRFAVNENVERESPATDRALYKWRRPSEILPGWTRCFGILVPPRVTQMPLPNSDDVKAVQFVEPPAGDKKVIFNIILSKKDAKPEDVIKGSAHDITIQGCIEMRTELAWLVSFVDDFTSVEKAVVTDDFNKLKIHLSPGSTGDSIKRAFMHIIDKDAVFLTDIELGVETFVIPAT